MSIMKLHTALGEQARVSGETVYGGLLGLIGFVRVVVKVGKRAGQIIDRAGFFCIVFCPFTRVIHKKKKERPGLRK